jgi:serine/threonine protein kinase
LTPVKKLDEGTFGIVFYGYWNVNKSVPSYQSETRVEMESKSEKEMNTIVTKKAITDNLNRINVAIKINKNNEIDIVKKFIFEATLLSHLDHENIVKLHGISIDREPFMLVFEYMNQGDLRNFLMLAHFHSF